jgi:hypothetical protein
MVAGSIAAHMVGAALAPATARPADGDGGELTGLHDRASGGYSGHAVIWIGLVVALVAVAGIRGLLCRCGKRESRGLGAWCFFLLPLLAFTFQEISERLLHAESVPFHAVFEPRFLLGLALQLPFAGVAFIVAWLLLRVGKRLLRFLARRPGAALDARSTPSWALAAVALPRVRPLSRGHPLRGPPLLA